MYRYFKQIVGVGNGDCIYYWQSKGFSDGRVSSIETCDCGIIPKLSYNGTKTRVRLNGCCLIQD